MKPASKKSASGGSGFSVYTALYVIFKHKWKIFFLTLLGLGAATGYAYHLSQQPSYESVAKLMVQYIGDPSTLEPGAGGQVMRGGMVAEMEILNSGDTAKRAAEKVGPAKILPRKEGAPATAMQAGTAILGGLKVDSPRMNRYQQSNILNVSYRSGDPEVTVEVLQAMIDTYIVRHYELHRSIDFEIVAKQAEDALGALKQTEADINKLKAESGVLAIDSTMAEFEARRQAIRESRDEIDAQLAEQRAKVEALEASFEKAGADQQDPLAPKLVEEKTEETPQPEDATSKREKAIALSEYRNLAKRLDLLQSNLNQLLLERKPGDPMVRSLEAQLKSVRAQGLDLLERYPEFAGEGGPRTAFQAPVSSLEDERAFEAALTAKLAAIDKQREELNSEVEEISKLSFELQNLDRRRQLEDEKYRYFQSKLDKLRIEEKLNPKDIGNISVIQSPTLPVRSFDEDAKKLLAGLAASGLMLGLGLAFLIEMVIDRRVSRPIEIETRLQLPLMLSIPYTRSKDGIGKLIGSDSSLEVVGKNGDLILPPVQESEVAHGAGKPSEHFIAPYAEAIRDRMIFNFEVNNINHKPKLVAVTGLSSGAGASTVAAGVARAFGETGDRKVLLVNLHPSNRGDGFQCHPSASLVQALESSKSPNFRESPRSLYYATAPTRRQSGNAFALVPTKLQELMPALTTSDFDYIIFDMPPVSPTSPTLAMAGFMDKVLLVLDAENTTRESLQWGYSQLEKGRADVSCVYNKARSHAPRWVQGAA